MAERTPSNDNRIMTTKERFRMTLLDLERAREEATELAGIEREDSRQAARIRESF